MESIGISLSPSIGTACEERATKPLVLGFDMSPGSGQSVHNCPKDIPKESESTTRGHGLTGQY
jgi:hypothetical protein